VLLQVANVINMSFEQAKYVIHRTEHPGYEHNPKKKKKKQSKINIIQKNQIEKWFSGSVIR
jgi:hypothetical protein